MNKERLLFLVLIVLLASVGHCNGKKKKKVKPKKNMPEEQKEHLTKIEESKRILKELQEQYKTQYGKYFVNA